MTWDSVIRMRISSFSLPPPFSCSSHEKVTWDSIDEECLAVLHWHPNQKSMPFVSCPTESKYIGSLSTTSGHSSPITWHSSRSLPDDWSASQPHPWGQLGTRAASFHTKSSLRRLVLIARTSIYETNLLKRSPSQDTPSEVDGSACSFSLFLVPFCSNEISGSYPSASFRQTNSRSWSGKNDVKMQYSKSISNVFVIDPLILLIHLPRWPMVPANRFLSQW